ncbi:DNA methyltransferase, partial [Streptomyces sp. SID8455]|nr:DNA methyltransferase [Streptomyces sp. SID8455]
ERDGTERDRARTEQSFCVSKADIAAQGYDLSLNRYKEIVHEENVTRTPAEIVADLEQLNEEIIKGADELKGMLA